MKNRLLQNNNTSDNDSSVLPIVLPIVAALFVIALIVVIWSLKNRNRCFCSCAGPLGDCLKFCGYVLTCGCIR